MERPRRPGRKASIADWNRYHEEFSRWTVWNNSQRLRETLETGPRVIQHEDEDTEVNVKSGFSRDRDTPTSDFIIIDRHSATGGHQHVIYDDKGNEITNHWKENR